MDPQNHTEMGSLLLSRFVDKGAEVTWVMATEGRTSTQTQVVPLQPCALIGPFLSAAEPGKADTP